MWYTVFSSTPKIVESLKKNSGNFKIRDNQFFQKKHFEPFNKYFCWVFSLKNFFLIDFPLWDISIFVPKPKWFISLRKISKSAKINFFQKTHLRLLKHAFVNVFLKKFFYDRFSFMRYIDFCPQAKMVHFLKENFKIHKNQFFSKNTFETFKTCICKYFPQKIFLWSIFNHEIYLF